MSDRLIVSSVTATFFVLLFFFASECTQAQKTQSVGDARTKLEQLYKELRWKDAGYYNLLDAELKKRIDNRPKGEFETTKQYEARTEKNSKLEEVIEKEVLDKMQPRIDFLNREIANIMSQRFPVEVRIALDRYDADKQTFAATTDLNAEVLQLYVPLATAPTFKEGVNNKRFEASCSLAIDPDGRAKPYLREVQLKQLGSFIVDPPEMTEDRAMMVLFGKKAVNGGVDWYRITGENTLSDEERDDRDVVASFKSQYDPKLIHTLRQRKTRATPIFSKQFTENGKVKFILAAASLAYLDDGSAGEFGSVGCHWCGLPIGLIQFVRLGELWNVEGIARDVGTYGGGWGSKPDVKLLKLGSNVQGIAINGGGMGMGEEISDWAILANVRGSIKEVFSYTDSDDSTGTGVLNENSIQVKRKITFIEDGASDLMDIKMTTNGRRGSKIGTRYVWKPVATTELFRFNGDKYKPVNADVSPKSDASAIEPPALPEALVDETRVGSNGTAGSIPQKAIVPDVPLRILASPRPGFTTEARKNEIHGSVILNVEFRADGSIGSVTPVKTLGGGLTEQAIAAAQRITFEPARKNGVPITVMKQITYSFSTY